MYSTLSGWSGFVQVWIKWYKRYTLFPFQINVLHHSVYFVSQMRRNIANYSATRHMVQLQASMLMRNCGITHRTCAYDAICQIRWELTTCYYILYLYCCVFFGAKKRKENYWMINKLVLIVFFSPPFPFCFIVFLQ